MNELTERDRQVIDFAKRRYGSAGRRAADIRTEFGWSEARYAQVLDHVLGMPDALAYDARTVNRLLRLRDARRAVRTAS